MPCRHGVGAPPHGQQRALVDDVREVRAREAVRARRDAIQRNAGREAHARGVAGSVRAWAWSADEGRVAATVVWPGFDDSGVAGWGGMNLTGEDGLPLCVRVADELEGAFFATTQAAALDCRPDWIQIATWNDWNELTQIEPAWHPQLEEELRAGALSPEVLQHCFGRALEAQAMAAEFLGLELSEGELLDAAHAYLLEVAKDPAAPSYD